MRTLAAAAAGLAAAMLGAALARGGPPRRPAGEPAPAARRRPNRTRRSIVLGVAIGVLVLALAGPIALVGACSVTVLARTIHPIRAARHRRALIEGELPPTIDLLVLAVRAGLSPRQAFGELALAVGGPVGEAIGEVTRRTERGQPFADALAALVDLLGPRAAGLADALIAGERHGVAIGPTLDQLAIEADNARQRLAQADARRLPVRLSYPLVLCTLPSFVLLAVVPPVIAAVSSLGDPAP